MGPSTKGWDTTTDGWGKITDGFFQGGTTRVQVDDQSDNWTSGWPENLRVGCLSKESVEYLQDNWRDGKGAVGGVADGTVDGVACRPIGGTTYLFW